MVIKIQILWTFHSLFTAKYHQLPGRLKADWFVIQTDCCAVCYDTKNVLTQLDDATFQSHSRIFAIALLHLFRYFTYHDSHTSRLHFRNFQVHHELEYKSILEIDRFYVFSACTTTGRHFVRHSRRSWGFVNLRKPKNSS